MAQVGSIYQEETTQQTHTGNLTYTTKFTVAGSSFEATTEYIYMLKAQIGGSNSNGRFKYRLQVGGVTQEGAEVIMEPFLVFTSGGGFYETYFFFDVFTTPASPDDIIFQIAPQQDTSHTVAADSIVFLALKLDDLAASDWVFAEDTTDGDHTTGSTFGDEASITFTPATAGDDWLILAWGSVIVNNATKNYRYRINRDADTELDPIMGKEGEDTAEEHCWVLMRPFTLTAAEHTFKVQSNDDSAAGAENKHNISKIFALRLNAFEDHAIFWDSGTFNTPDTSFNEIADMSFAATTTGNGVCLGTLTCGSSVTARVQLDGTTIPTGQDAYETEVMENDSTDLMPLAVVARGAITAASSADFDVDAKVPNAAIDLFDRGFVSFSLEIATGGVTIAAPLDVMSMVDNIPLVGTGVLVDVPLDVMSMVDNIPLVGTGVLVDVPLDVMSMTDNIPAVASGGGVIVPLDVMTMTEFIPTIDASEGEEVSLARPSRWRRLIITRGI